MLTSLPAGTTSSNPRPSPAPGRTAPGHYDVKANASRWLGVETRKRFDSTVIEWFTSGAYRSFALLFRAVLAGCASFNNDLNTEDKCLPFGGPYGPLSRRLGWLRVCELQPPPHTHKGLTHGPEPREAASAFNTDADTDTGAGAGIETEGDADN